MLLKSPISCMGGKYYLTGWLSQYIPEHTSYIEPFCGAGHLLFAKEASQVEVINDIDGHLIAFFKVIQHPERRQRLIDLLAFMPYSRALWQDIRSRWKAGNIPGDPVESSAQWFYLNRSTFGGDQKRGGFAVPSVTGRNPVQSFRNSIKDLDTIAERLRCVTIECLDYADCIQRYDSETTLFYCDPPYLNTEDYYGKGCFTQDDHRTLAGLLNNIRGWALVSHYKDTTIAGLYSGWNCHEFQSFKGSHKAASGESKPKTLECLFCNFEPLKTRGLFNAME